MGYKRLYLTILLLLVSGCSSAEPVVLTGRTMGTTWRILIAEKAVYGNLKPEIESRLESINKSMSLFRKESELSRFNRPDGARRAFCFSKDFMAVYTVGKELYRLTGGAWDGTAGPLVNLWGFGNETGSGIVPEETLIAEKLAHVGFGRIDPVRDNCLRKKDPEMVLDFGSIAKGYGVDVIATLLKEKGFKNYLIEIGGEVYGAGTKFGKEWRIGISLPDRTKLSQEMIETITLKDKAIATSGDYRNFRKIDGEYYSHIIDPGTGWPLKNNVASVSVAADTTVFADGLATALMVMGVEKGIALVDSLDGVDCMMIVRNSDGSFSPWFSGQHFRK